MGTIPLFFGGGTVEWPIVLCSNWFKKFNLFNNKNNLEL